MTKQREILIEKLASYLNDFISNHPVRVALDGVDTSGKTTLANELIAPLENLGRPVIRSSVDKFHSPRIERYKRGKDSPEGYYFDSFNIEAILKRLLLPLGTSGSLVYRDESFNFKTDSKINAKPKKASLNAILLFDGVFLLRPELNPYWDIRIFLQVPFEEVLKRAKIRDQELMGTDLESKYKTRYIPGQKLYLNSVHPEKLADIIIDNLDFNYPVIHFK